MTTSTYLTGNWILDRTNSDKPTPHLESLGLSDLARSAAERLDFSMQITHSDREISITQNSILGVKERRLQFGVEHLESGRDKTPVRMMASLVSSHPVAVSISIEWEGRSTINETKRLDVDQSGAEIIIQDISMTMKGSKVSTNTTRLWRRAPEGTEVGFDIGVLAALD